MDVSTKKLCPGGEYCSYCRSKERSGLKKMLESKQGITVYQTTTREVVSATVTDATNVLKFYKPVHNATSATLNKSPKVAKGISADDMTVIVIHNTNDSDIQSTDVLQEFDIEAVSCPRCRYKMAHAKKLLASLPVVKRKHITCVCDLCALKRMSRFPCHVCQEVIKKFEISGIKDELIDDYTKKRIMSYVANASRLLKTDVTYGKKRMVRSFSECAISKMTEQRRKYGQCLGRPKSALVVENLDDNLANLLDRKRAEKPSSVVQKSERKEIYPKSILKEIDHISVKPQQVDLSALTTRDEIQITDRTVFKKSPYHAGDVKPGKSDIVLGIGTTGLIRRAHSDDSLITSFSGITEAIFKKNFKYFFPRIVKEDEHTFKTSAELIQDTQERLQSQLETKIGNQDEHSKMKMGKKRNKNIAKEELQRKTELAKRERIMPLDERLLCKIDKNTGFLVKKEIRHKKASSFDKIKKGRVEKETKGILEKRKKPDVEISKRKLIRKVKQISVKKQEQTFKEKVITKKQDIITKEKLEPDEIFHSKTKKPDHKRKIDKDLEIKYIETKDAKVGSDSSIYFENIEISTDNSQLRNKKDAKDSQLIVKIIDKHDKEKQEIREPQYGDRTKVKAVLEGSTKKEVNVKIEKENKEKLTKEHVNLVNKMLTKQEEVNMKHNKLRSQQESKLSKIKKRAFKATQHDVQFDLPTHNIKKKEPINQIIPQYEKKTVGAKLVVPLEKIKIQAPDVPADDLLLRLIKLRGTRNREYTAAGPIADLPIISLRKLAHTQTTFSNVSESQTEIISEREIQELVLGNEITNIKNVPHKSVSKEQPILFETVFEENKFKPKVTKTPLATDVSVKEESGVFQYLLSDRTYIDKGWTLLPEEKIIQKMNIYRMYPAQPKFDWFERNKDKKLTYDSGEKLADIDSNGRGRWFYKNGRVALDYYDSEETNSQQRFVVYSSGEPDGRGRSRPVTVLGMFDYLGNGIVFDHFGKIRLKYNQSEGVVLDRDIGPVSHWKWHSLNDPPELLQIMTDTQLKFKDENILKFSNLEEEPQRPENEEMLAIELDNYIKLKNKASKKFQPYQIRMKALKLNDQFSLRVLDQKRVYLFFREGATKMKLNLGMELDPNEIIETSSCELGHVMISMENTPAVTKSIENLQKRLAKAAGIHRVRRERESWKKPPPPGARADQLTAAASRPLRPPLQTEGPTSTQTKCRVVGNNNLYYNTRLI